MNICIITSQYPSITGGLGSTVFRVARNLAKSNYNVHVIAPGSNRIENEIGPSWEEGVTVHRTYRALSDSFSNDFEINDIGRYIINLHKEVEFDLIHCMSLIPVGLLAYVVSKEINCPFVVSVQNGDIQTVRYNSVLLNSMTWVLEQASMVTFPSIELLIKAKQVANIQQIQIVPNGFDPDLFDQRSLQELIQEQKWRSRFFGETFIRFKSKEAFVVGNTSIIRPEKGFHLCLAAFKALQHTHPNSCFLHVGGFATIQEKNNALKLIRKLGLKQRVFLAGLVPHRQVLCWIKEMDIFVFPSLDYGTSNALLEAMGIGLPVIASNIENATQMIKDGEDGLLIRPRATELWGHMMKSLAINKDLRRQLGESARLKVEKQFSAKKELELYQNIYQDVVGIFKKVIFKRREPENDSK